MTQESINQITPQDLAKINGYLDQMEQELKDHYSEKEIIEIIQLTREQLFQQIEFQVAVRGSFDLDLIIEKNRKSNSDLLSGNDRNQVVFTIKNPFSKLSSPVEKRAEVADQQSEPRSDQTTQDHDPQRNRPNQVHSGFSTSSMYEIDENVILFMVSIILTSLAFVPSEGTLIAHFVGLPIFLLISVFLTNHYNSTWIQANYLFIVGLLFAATNDAMTYNELIYALTYIVVPLYGLVFVYQILKNDILVEYTSSTTFIKGSIFVFGLIIFAGPLILISWLLYLAQWGLDISLVIPLITSVVMYIVYRFGLSPRLSTWDRKLGPKTGSKTASQDEDEEEQPSMQSKHSEAPNMWSPETTPPQDRSDQPQIYAPKISPTSLSQMTSLFAASDQDNVFIEVDRREASKFLSFRWFSIFRLLVVLLAITSFGISYHFSQLGRYAIEYYMRSMGFDPSWYPFYYFQRDATITAMLVGLGFLGLLGLLLLIELARWINRRTKKKVISHLVLRQGTIPVKMLNQTPPNMDPDVYYRILGELTMDDILVIRHQEVSK